MRFHIKAFIAITGMWMIFAAVAVLFSVKGWWSYVWFAAWLIMTSAFVGWMHERDVEEQDGNTKKRVRVRKMRKVYR